MMIISTPQKEDKPQKVIAEKTGYSRVLRGKVWNEEVHKQQG